MRPRTALLAIALALPTAVIASAPAQAAPVCDEFAFPNNPGERGQVAATLSGAEVVGPSNKLGAGDPDGNGTVVLLLLFYDTNKLAHVSYQFDTNDIALPLEGAHIHKGKAGSTNNLIATSLFGFSDQADRSGEITMSKCLAHEIFHRPSDYYIDVHNTEYVDDGALRGQLFQGA